MTAIKQRNVTGFAPRSGHNEVKNSSHTSMAYNIGLQELKQTF